MSTFVIICAVLGAYSMLNLLGGERQRRLMELDARVKAEQAAAEAHAKLHGQTTKPAQAHDKPAA